MSNKKKVFIIIAILIIIAVICWLILRHRSSDTIINTGEINSNKPVQEVLVKESDDGTKVNISENIKDAKFNIDGLEITGIKLSELAGMTELTATVKNTTSQVKGDLMLDITLFGADNSEMVKVAGYVGSVEPNGTYTLNISAPLDYSEAYRVKIEKK